ncbi:MAG: MFS transporter, partial [Alphaproteobacteria bacterium]|nr:MFS transporter [Alphaproteobacteria bacterium]
MDSSVNAGARLDRLPISRFHYRIFWLIAAGMFFDGYDLYVAGPVLGAALQSKFSTLSQNGWFLSLTFIGMTLGSLLAGFLGDRYGRRFTYQFNLMIFGLASLAAAFAPSIEVLNALRFAMGVGLGAEIVVGYGTMTEFVPPHTRGRWMAFMAFVVVSGLPATAVLGWAIVPSFGWRPLFVIAGIGALIVWYLRKALPESPRWLDANGRSAEAERLLERIESEVGETAPLPRPGAPQPVVQIGLRDLLSAALLPSMVVGSVVLVTINALIFGFVNWLPTFFVQQGLSITKSFGYTLVIITGSPIGCALGAFACDYFGRKRSLIAAALATIALGAVYPFMHEPASLLTVGFFLIVAIYVQVAILFGVYTPELFPTEVRLRANGICNTLGRAATIVSPFIVVALFRDYGVGGVLSLMIGLLVIQIIVVAGWGI